MEQPACLLAHGLLPVEHHSLLFLLSLRHFSYCCHRRFLKFRTCKAPEHSHSGSDVLLGSGIAPFLRGFRLPAPLHLVALRRQHVNVVWVHHPIQLGVCFLLREGILEVSPELCQAQAKIDLLLLGNLTEYGHVCRLRPLLHPPGRWQACRDCVNVISSQPLSQRVDCRQVSWEKGQMAPFHAVVIHKTALLLGSDDRTCGSSHGSSDGSGARSGRSSGRRSRSR